MKNRRKPRWLCGLLGAALFFQLSFVSLATAETQEKIDAMKEKVEQTEKDLEEAEKKQKKLEESKQSMENYLQDLNKQFSSISAQLTELEKQKTDKEEEIRTTEQELAEAKEREEQQYADMKQRIRYLYEHPQDSLLTLLFGEGTFSSMLNRAQFTAQMAQYDREKLEEFAETKALIEEKEAELQGEKEALEQVIAETEQKKKEVNSLASSTSSKIGQYVKDIADAEADIDGKEGTLSDQKETLEALIAQYKAEEAAIEAAKGDEIDNSIGTDVVGERTTEQEYAQYGAYAATEEERAYLAVLIHCEAANQGDAGRLAVGAVVMNRVRSSRFPQGDIISVIRASGQFSPVTSGRFDLIYSESIDSVSQACWDAADRAIAGESNVGDRTFFRTYKGHPNLSGLVIGDHIFSHTWNYVS